MTHWGGYLGLATAAAAWYASFAAVTNSTFGRTVMPVMPLGEAVKVKNRWDCRARLELSGCQRRYARLRARGMLEVERFEPPPSFASTRC